MLCILGKNLPILSYRILRLAKELTNSFQESVRILCSGGRLWGGHKPLPVRPSFTAELAAMAPPLLVNHSGLFVPVSAFIAMNIYYTNTVLRLLSTII
jgi:hypothetical protein